VNTTLPAASSAASACALPSSPPSPTNPVDTSFEDLMYQGGVDQSHVRWVKYDGVGRTVRNGLNFTERGFGVRAALGCSDRAIPPSPNSAGEIDWDEIFMKEGTRGFTPAAIFAALSESTPLVAKEAIEAAHRNGVIVFVRPELPRQSLEIHRRQGSRP